jgi:tRNA pseudouridine55 synthase
MILGVATDTQDTFGTTIAREPCGNVTAESLREIFPRFLGKIMQKPPIYSAVHHEGERLYDLARRGVEVAVKPRAVEIHSIDLVDFGSGRALIDVSCGPGTYVRALVNDLGEALGCGATLSFLVRTRSGPFHIDDAVLIEEAAPCALLPIDRPLSHMRAVILDEKMLHPFLHGCRSQSNKFTVDRGSQSPGIYKVYSPVKEFLGLGEIIPGRQMSLVPLKIFPRE